MPPNLYEILGIQKNATTEEVRKAYKQRALKTHPDRLPQGFTAEQKAQAEEQFRLVNNAYEVLNDTKKRELYDKHGVWPPPAAPEPSYRGDPNTHTSFTYYDPFMSDPFFQTPFGRNAHPFVFTDPFELFDSIFGSTHGHFGHDPFFHDTFPSSSRSLFGNFFTHGFDEPHFLTGLPPAPYGIPDLNAYMHPGESSDSRVYSSSTSAFGMNGQWVSNSQMTRTINGRTETIIKRRDTQGNEHITYRSPAGERYTINGIEQPIGALPGPGGGSGNARPPEPTPTTTTPPPQITADPYAQHTRLPPSHTSRRGSQSGHGPSYAPYQANSSSAHQDHRQQQKAHSSGKHTSRSEHRERAVEIEREKVTDIPRETRERERETAYGRDRRSSVRPRHDSLSGSRHSHTNNQHETHQPPQHHRSRDITRDREHDRRRDRASRDIHSPPISPVRSHHSQKRRFNGAWLSKVWNLFKHDHRHSVH